MVLKQDRDGSYGFSLSKETPIVTQVGTGSSAERAGIHIGDRLIKVILYNVTSRRRVKYTIINIHT